ncbi:hypothetical protein BLA29_004936, partial [Euroglyphus maynei]
MDRSAYTLAIERLNRLQSNAEYLRNAAFGKKSNSLERTNHFLRALGIEIEDLNRLMIIHVAGTKGKGSTCAFVESILRLNGYKTGFYSSPHLVAVRERIRINGEPISEDKFARHFHHVYNILEANKTNEFKMPGYFNFLTIMAFYVFLKENVDVAIMEVGIGGKLDCTNVVEKPIVTGVTSLDFDHCRLLGNTLTEIAQNKAGIFKQGVPALTVQQPEEAMFALKETAQEVNAPLYIVPPWSNYPDSSKIDLGIQGEAQKLNASLAVQLVNVWLSRVKYRNSKFITDSNEKCGFLDAITLGQNHFALGLSKTVWHGRCEIIRKGNITFFLDAAHTIDSMNNCRQWFSQQIERFTSTFDNISTDGTLPKIHRVFVFNCTGDRDPRPLLAKSAGTDFDLAIFTTNRLMNEKKIDSDHSNLTITENHEDEIRSNNARIWQELFPPVKSLQVECIRDCIEQIVSYSRLVQSPTLVL